MKRYESYRASRRSKFWVIILLSVVPFSCRLAATPDITAPQPDKEVLLQQRRTWRAEKAQDLARRGDRLRSLINPLNDVLKNPKIVTKAATRKQALSWAQAINQQVFKVVEKLRGKKIPMIATLKESAIVISLCIDKLYEGLSKGLDKNIINSPVIEKNLITEKLQVLITQLQVQLTKTLATQRSILSEEEQKMLPEKADDRMIDMVMIDQFITAIDQGLDNLADLIQDYGITKINRAARVIDELTKKALYNPYMPYIGLSAIIAGAGIGTYLIQANFRSPDHGGPIFWHVLQGSLAAALSGGGGWIFNSTWGIAHGHLKEIRNRMSTWWKKCQGLPVKEKINGFDILKPEDCEGEEEPHIGLEAPFGRVMDSISSALVRMQNGEREPLKGIQRTFVFIAPAGMGKTFLMEQLKREIAKLNQEFSKLNQFGMTIAYENLQGEQLVFGDLMGRIKEAQQKNMGLVLWIDEMHLYKPMKDANQPLLAQLLQTEFINKSNTPIWIFAATNEPGRFDNALIRSGRFEVINIYEPTFTDRMRLFDYYLRQQGVVLSSADLALFAAETHGASPATIRKVINSARASGIALTRELIQEKILELVFKITPGFESLHAKEQREIAAYQVGKLLVHVLNALEHDKTARKQFFTGKRFALATAAAVEKPLQELAGFVVEPVANNPNFAKGARRAFGKIFVYDCRENQAIRIHEKELLVSELLAGSCAQELCLQDVVDDMRQDDIKLAFEYCIDIVRDGIPLKQMSRDDQQACLKKAHEIFTATKHRTMTLLKEHIDISKAMINFMLQIKEYPHINALDVIMLLDKKTPGDGKNEEQSRQETISGERTSEAVTLAAT